jgi:CheY-like chemotaxis protein
MAPTPNRQDSNLTHLTDNTGFTDNISGARRDIHILLVEDSPINQKIVLHILQKKLGYSTDAVSDGNQALDALRNRRYDLVLMDCQMPVMDGYQATSIIRDPSSDVLDNDVRIVAITANAMKGDREKCLAAGMDDYITKPTMPTELAGIVERNLSASHATGAPPTPKQPDRIDQTGGSEWTDDPELAKILDEFVEGLPVKMTAMRQAIDNNCFDEVRRIAHQLKGTGGGYGYPALTESARGLENAAQAECRESTLLALIQLNTLCQAVIAGHHADVMTRKVQS